MQLPGSTRSTTSPHLKLVQSTAVPALIAAVLFFMSGGDLVIIALAFALLIWSFFSTRRHHAEHARAVAQPVQTEATDFLRAGIEWCQSMSGAKRVVLWLVDDATGLVRPIAATGGSWPKAHVLHGSPVTWIARERVATRIAPPPEWAETLRVIGVDVLQAQATHALTLELVDDLDVSPEQFKALGIYIGALLNVEQDHQLLAEIQNRTQLLIEALRALPSATDAASLAHALINAAVRLTDGSGAALVAWSPDSAEIIAAEGAGLAARTRVTEPDTLVMLAARGDATLIKEGAALRGLPIISERERLLPSPDAAAAIPLSADGEVIGVLVVWTANVKQLPEAAITALETIAPYAGVQLRHARELGFMRDLAERDALTGLSNRRAFDVQLQAEWARWERSRRPFSLLLFDLDHFKRINDQNGHDAGDEVLRTVGRALAGLVRGRDFAARYGGEEFAVLLAETPAKAAAEIAERIRAHIETTIPVFAGKQLPVTISGGVATSTERMTAEEMVRAADRLLYKAKAEGRNRVLG